MAKTATTGKKPAAKKPASKKTSAPEQGDEVTWNWGSGEGEGKVAAVHTGDVSKTINGKKITRHASPDKPAVEIATDKGGRVLKSSTEIHKK